MNDEFEHYLDQYAQIIMQVGVNVQADQRVLIRAPVQLAPFVRSLVQQAYTAGARFADVLWSDQHIFWTHLKYGPDNVMTGYEGWGENVALDYIDAGDALVTIYAPDPQLLADIDPTRVQSARQQVDQYIAPVLQRITQNRVRNGGFFSGAHTGWATSVFPDEEPEQAVARLWDAIFDVCRAKMPDPIAAWQSHIADLDARATYLNHKQYVALHYQAPGTDLTVGLPPGHVWHSIMADDQAVPHVPNIPSEEVYTLPDCKRIDGTVTATRPLSWHGSLIAGFSLTFEQGRVVDARAGEGDAGLQMLLDTDGGARSLGEVALVPHSSPVSQSGLIFYNALYDENAASHFALGDAYRVSLTGGTDMTDEAFAAAGGNMSSIHVDFMAGSAAMTVNGITSEGTTEPVMQHGEWAFDE